MTDCAVIIWSNSKLLEYMTISQLDYLKLQSRNFYTYAKPELSIIDEIM